MMAGLDRGQKTTPDNADIKGQTVQASAGNNDSITIGLKDICVTLWQKIWLLPVLKLQESKIQAGKLINLMEEISGQPNIQPLHGYNWLLLAKFTVRVREKKQSRKKSWPTGTSHKTGPKEV